MNRQLGRPAVGILGLLFLLAAGLIDYFTGEELSILALYLGPVSFVAWWSGRRDGLLMALASSMVWLAAELASNHHYTQGFIPYWNSLMLLCSFAIVVQILAALKLSYASLESRVQERTMALQAEVSERRRAEDRLLTTNTELSKSREELVCALEELKKSHAELKATQWQLIEAAKMELVGRLAAGVAHEVKNPLTTITMVGDYITHFVPLPDEETRLMLSDLREAVTRANRAVSELLEYSRPRELSMEPEDLHSILERCFAMLKLELTKGRVNLVREFDLALPKLLLDRNKMDQVFINLLMNAIQAMPAGGTLTVRTNFSPAAELKAGQKNAGLVVIEIDDTGIGIPASNLPRLFDPFFTTKPPGQGTGLGLSVVRQIMQMHGGSIEIQNRPEGGVRVRLGFKIED